MSRPSVIKENNIYYMWYSGNNGGGWSIGLATSPDGLNWTKYGLNPVMSGSGGWENIVFDSTIIRDEGIYNRSMAAGVKIPVSGGDSEGI